MNALENLRCIACALLVSGMALLLIATPVNAEPILVELSAEANHSAANDYLRATVSAEARSSTPGELAKQVNTLISDAVKVARNFPSVKVQSGNTSTYPLYSKNNTIESWRMRSDLTLESGDPTAFSELLGKLQATLAVSGITLQPAADTRKKGENEAVVDAISAFKARAKVIAESLGKNYRIKQLTVNTTGRTNQPLYRAAAKSMLSESAPMPVEAGESKISAYVSGQIEVQ